MERKIERKKRKYLQNMKYHIITYGCQMNQNDSERIASFFEKKGFTKSSEKEADFIVVNSCSIRQSAIDRIEARLKKLENKKIILTGCVLDKDKEKLSVFFDYYWPPQDTSSWSLPEFKKNNEEFFKIEPKRSNIIAYISIMTGCNNFCSYCVVPYTKGRERSRNYEDVLKEATKAVSDGHKEIWLLGQNVNSFDGGITFPELLKKINNIKGDFWVRFASSHPKDTSSELIKTIKQCKKVTNYLHLPIQSGDNEILKKMNRPYTVKQYKNIIEEARKTIPGISISTDVIVGFPGETEKNFSNTVRFFIEAEFNSAYIARYSPRLQTAASKIKETVKNEEKKRREKILEEVIKENALKQNKSLLRKNLTVLVMRKNKKGLLIGKTEGFQNVIFKGNSKLIGSFVKIKITHCSSWGLKGEVVQK